MDVQRVGLLIALGTTLALGCGFRSDPLIPEGLEAGDEVGSDDDGTLDVDPNRPGSCNDRLPFPTMDARVTGELPRDGSLTGGWCTDENEGPDRGDDLSGPEDAYVLVPEFTTDITIRMDTAATGFDAVLRVESGDCGGEDLLVCDNRIDEEPFHFLAEAGKEYTITVDSRRPLGDTENGAYAFDVVYGFPGLELCPVHPESINQVSGATFIWENNFSEGQGRVDGFCGGPGSENMFTLNANYAGFMFMTVSGSNGFSPVISLRTSCAATSELACARDGDTGVPGVAELEAFIEGPGQYFVVVDQTSIDGGDYRLDIFFE